MMKLTKDHKKVLKKWSTWLSGLTASMVAGAGSILFLGAVPFIHPALLMGLAFITVILIPLATSISQWPADDSSES